VNDEVRLHSRFLYSLLDPRGNHYQGGLFLELFLKQANLEDWLNLDNVLIHKEKDSIDLYLTDGNNHIIIENKLDAKDQWQQVKKYIEKIQRKWNTINIVFIYLSKDRVQPSKDALGEYFINTNEGYLQNSEKIKFSYKNMHYKKHILDWLSECKKEILNLKNLYNAISEYEQVVLKAIGSYRSPVMNIKDFLSKENSALAIENKVKIILEIESQLPILRSHWLDTAMTTGIDDFMSGYPVTKLIQDKFIELNGHIFHRGIADRVFSRNQKQHKNRSIKKGSLWKIDAGEYKDKLSLILWMDTGWLHVGVVPISKKPDGFFIFTKNNEIDENIENVIDKITKSVFIDNKKMERRPQENPIPMHLLVSWGNEPENEVNQLYDFDKSRQGRTFAAIFEKLGIERNTFLSS
jgi:hypothetical protein